MFGANVEPEQLLAKTTDEKSTANRCIAFQVPEATGGPCGRTFEDAFILANRTMFPLAGTTREELECSAATIAGEQKKSEVALQYAIKQTTWTTPSYILRGLQWLAGGPTAATVDPGLALISAAKAAEGNQGATNA